jgi:hypothetical protein
MVGRVLHSGLVRDPVSCLGMILSENRLPLFGIMPWRQQVHATARRDI